MPDPADLPAQPAPGAPDAPAEDGGRFGRDRVLAYVLPMVVYIGLSSLEPAAPAVGDEPEPGLFGLTHDHYPAIYTAKLAITAVALWLCRPAWGQWRLRKARGLPLAVAVGAIGVVLWIACCSLDLEGRLFRAVGEDSPVAGLLTTLGVGAERAAYNPWDQLGDTPTLLAAFLVVRFIGLAGLVPVFEELMLRGWLMRSVDSARFWEVPFGRLGTQAIVVGTAFPMLYHPEKLASLVWFSLVTWLMIRTRSYWACVTAHAVTNLLLGVYVLATGAWWLW